jgi:hypothetical protein
MRLVGRLKKLETIAEEKPRVMAAGVVRTSDHEHYAGALQPGERVVSDVHIGEDYGGAQAWTLRDRPARDDDDLGDVYQDGELVGKVERVEGSLVVYRELISKRIAHYHYFSGVVSFQDSIDLASHCRPSSMLWYTATSAGGLAYASYMRISA